MIFRAHITTKSDPAHHQLWPFRQALLGTLMVVLVLSGCISQRQISEAQENGTNAGRSDGWSAGETQGYRDAIARSESKAYRETLWERYWSGDFQRQPLYRTGTVALGIILGIALQWGVFFELRRSQRLLDVDSILRGIGTKIIGGLFLAAWLFSAQGCTNPVKQAWQTAYDNEFKEAFQEGLRSGNSEGNMVGRERGVEQADEAARTGKSLFLYSDLIAGGALGGLLIGIAGQYLSLLVIRLTGEIDEFWTKLMVPAIAQTTSYRWLIGRREEFQRYHEQLKVIDQGLQATCAQMKSNTDRAKAQLEEKSREIEAHKRRVLRETEVKFAKIARNAGSTISSTSGTALRRARCPKCTVVARYKPELAGKLGRCGSCQSIVRLPPHRN